MTEVEILIKDLEILRDSTEKDKGSSANFARAVEHIRLFNELLGRAQQLGFGGDIKEIPADDLVGRTQPNPRIISIAIAKMGEVNTETQRLLSRFVEDQAELTKAIISETSVEQIATHFHNVVRQLRSRHDDRDTLKVHDEYDVQDLMHALLRLFFEDIRAEEWTPSYAGGAARMDFLLKNEEIVIETKMARESLTPKKLGEELIVDIAKYAQHPSCKTLFCFVYDPMGFIPNPRGIETDLKKEGPIRVVVLITPY